jgi:hypothetical protein
VTAGAARRASRSVRCALPASSASTPGLLTGWGSDTVIERMSISSATTPTTAPLQARAMSQPPHCMMDGSGDGTGAPTNRDLVCGEGSRSCGLITTNRAVTEPPRDQNCRKRLPSPGRIVALVVLITGCDDAEEHMQCQSHKTSIDRDGRMSLVTWRVTACPEHWQELSVG